MRHLKLALYYLLRKLLGLPSAYNFVFGAGDNKIHRSLRYSRLKIFGRVNIQEGCKFKDGVFINAQKTLSVGRYTSINGPGTTILSIHNGIEIGSFCSIARGVDFQEYNHPLDRASTYFIFKNFFNESRRETTSRGGIYVGNDVWIGAKATILSGVRISDGAVIAAHSVVTKDVGPYEIVGGVPAKLLSKRFDDVLIERLLYERWWDWPNEKLRRNRSFFEEKLTLASFDKLLE